MDEESGPPQREEKQRLILILASVVCENYGFNSWTFSNFKFLILIFKFIWLNSITNLVLYVYYRFNLYSSIGSF